MGRWSELSACIVVQSVFLCSVFVMVVMSGEVLFDTQIYLFLILMESKVIFRKGRFRKLLIVSIFSLLLEIQLKKF